MRCGKLKPEIKQAWLRRLRSTEERAFHCLCDDREGLFEDGKATPVYCALGHLLLAMEETGYNVGPWRNLNYLPYEAYTQMWAEFPDIDTVIFSNPERDVFVKVYANYARVSEMSDDGVPFRKIAEIVKRTL